MLNLEKGMALYQLGIDIGEMDSSILASDWEEVSTSLDDAELQLKLLFNVTTQPGGTVSLLRNAISIQNQDEALKARDNLNEAVQKLIDSKGQSL